MRLLLEDGDAVDRLEALGAVPANRTRSRSVVPGQTSGPGGLVDPSEMPRCSLTQVANVWCWPSARTVAVMLEPSDGVNSAYQYVAPRNSSASATECPGPVAV